MGISFPFPDRLPIVVGIDQSMLLVLYASCVWNYMRTKSFDDFWNINYEQKLWCRLYNFGILVYLASVFMPGEPLTKRLVLGIGVSGVGFGVFLFFAFLNLKSVSCVPKERSVSAQVWHWQF